MEQKVDQKVRQLLQRPDGEDVHMTGEDERVTALEQRMNRMEQTLRDQSTLLATQHAETQAQIHQVKTQVDSQNATVNQLLDHRFQEQLSEIERLLAKRSKQAE